MPPTQIQKACTFNPLSLTEFLRSCCNGETPQPVQAALAKDTFLNDLVCFAHLLGFLEPACLRRPDGCEPRLVVDRDVTLPPACIVDGKVVPSEERILSLCAPLNKALVVDQLRVTAGNLTAASQPYTQPVYKRVNLGDFGEWCLPFEPLDAGGQFANVEHVIVPPKGGFSVFVQNYNPASEAIYHIHAELWACC